MTRKAAARACSAMVCRARTTAADPSGPAPASSAPRATSGANRSVSKTVTTPWVRAAMRSRPMPVSMLGRGSGVSDPPSSMSYWGKTRFQYSRKRSQSQPGAHSGRPQPTSGPMS